MIAGMVNANREATIHLMVVGPQGHQQEIEAIIDTGFTGFLTLPHMLVTTLGLSWLCRQPGILADGRIEYFDVYVVTVIWDGQPRTVEVEAADTEPLVGMSLLEHHALRIDVLNGGVVTDPQWRNHVMPKAKKSENVPKTMRETFERIVSLTDSVARQHLNDEYAQLMRYATAALCRKRPSPLSSGSPKIWACGIAHAIGMVNFLFDSSQDPHMKATDLYKAFGVSAGSGVAKSKIVRDTLDMTPLAPDWCLPSKMGDNPLAWMVMVDGLIVDARQLPREIQEVAYERGIIPYLPDALAPETPRARTRKAAKGSSSQAQCGLCGRHGDLTKTDCCGQWICDDAHTYQLFSYARNSCFRNHDRYTLCAAHYHEGHAGPWQACDACKKAFEAEMYVYYGTNEYNFEVLENPPEYAPTHCDACGAIIVLSDGGYSMGAEGYRCGTCTAKEFGDVC